MPNPRPIPKTKLAKAEELILALLKDAKKRAGKKPIPVNDPDYAEAYGVHRGFLIAMYGKYNQLMPIALPDGTITTAQDWFRSLKDKIIAPPEV